MHNIKLQDPMKLKKRESSAFFVQTVQTRQLGFISHCLSIGNEEVSQNNGILIIFKDWLTIFNE